jgi:polyhydroxybutyrate depolymerase
VTFVAILVVATACSASAGSAGSSAGTASSPERATASTGAGADAGTTVPDRKSSAGCTAPAAAPGVTVAHLTSGGQERTYQLTLPADYDGAKPLPIVFALHALTVSYTFVASMTGFADMAKSYDFVGVAPSGLVNGSTPYWQAADSPDNYDLDFINVLLDKLEADLCIDPSRVYSVGMSNGAQMSSLLACRDSDRITAVAPISGVEFPDICQGRPVPVIAFHGTADPIVTYEGGGLNANTIASQELWKGHPPPNLPENHGVDAAMATWATHNGCDAQPVEEQISHEVRRHTWQHCQAATVLYIIDGGGHAWPGKPVPQFEAQFGHGTTEIDASSLIFDFFLGASGATR